MHEFEIKLLSFLKERNESTLDELEHGTGLSRDQIIWAAEELVKSRAVEVQRQSTKSVMLSQEGKTDLKEFPEEKLVRSLAKTGSEPLSAIKDQVGLSWAKRLGWIAIDAGSARITDAGKSAVGGGYAAKDVLNRLHAAQGGSVDEIVSGNSEIVDSLMKRGLIEIRDRNVVKLIRITKEGAELLEKAATEKGIGPLTKEIIAKGTWRAEGFKHYDVNAPVEKMFPARLHPIREFINVVRQKWLEMGFIEVSGPIVETAFWNFDALFSPQDHPTREMQDTFFLSNPDELTVSDMEALEKVRKMHTAGWKEQWNEDMAKQAILRTQTTSVSAHYMRKLATAINASYPLKLFSIGQVFRNENLDYKHLAELHQYDGIIIGDGLTLANLIDTLKKFYGKLGFDNVKLRPSYFPFTEPSLEAFYYDEEHGDSIELTGGGIIRREITKALGIDKTVLAWGGGIERLLLNSKILGLDSVTTPYKNNIGWLRSRKNLKV